MSRIGKKPIAIPSGIKVALQDHTVRVEGPKGKLQRDLPPGVEVNVDAEQVQVRQLVGKTHDTSLLGLTRTLIWNMIEGVTRGFQKQLEINGVGYRADLKGKVLNLSLGYSHPIEFALPEGIEVEVEKQTKVTLSGIDKELVGATAAKIRSLREPEPYKGKGIKYVDEHIVRKAGKAAK